MKKEFLDYLIDILDVSEKAQEFVKGMTFEEFKIDFRTNFAVARSLEIIGEAVKRIPDDVKINYPQIPWRAIAGMRDKIIHGYDNINLLLVWETVTVKLPKIHKEFEQILQDYS
ncbi:MAG: DUF86 domain-containing protein [Calditrichaeota bacterium]|nr:MAG: DUF86 domain-containing protein [Calditrichota bacterium]